MFRKILSKAFIFLVFSQIISDCLERFGIMEQNPIQKAISSLKNQELQDQSIHSDYCPSTTFYSQIPENSKYYTEEHTVGTDDNINLRIFRIKLSEEYLKTQSNNPTIQKNINKPVLLIHGLIDSSDEWFENGEEKSIGFYLVNKGYDVWVMNNRGNKYSHSTPDKNMTHKQFYDFSFYEYGVLDVPAVFRLILQNSIKDSKIIVIGHSQGGQQFFVSLSDARTQRFIEYFTDKFIALAPSVIQFSFHPIINFLIDSMNKIFYHTIEFFNGHELLSHSCDINTERKIWYADMCKKYEFFCSLFFEFSGSAERNTNSFNAQQYFNHHPNGTSLKNLLHMWQAIKLPFNSEKDYFCNFDYGKEKNFEAYGTEKPTCWNQRSIKTKIILINGENDDQVSPTEARSTFSFLDNGINKHYELKNWDHDTYLFAKNPEPLFTILDKEM